MANIESIEAGQALLTGELTTETVPAIYQEGLRLLNQTSQLEFDLAKVSYSDSAGLALLLNWTRLALQQKKLIKFHHLPKQMQAMANLSDLHLVLPISE